MNSHFFYTFLMNSHFVVYFFHTFNYIMEIHFHFTGGNVKRNTTKSQFYYILYNRILISLYKCFVYPTNAGKVCFLVHC